ncbi:MAG: triple tyrosine motif-containing protein [Clostridiaceae bacterium]
MNEFGIVFNLNSPQEKNTDIEISVDVGENKKYLCKFLIGFQGKWYTMRDFELNSKALWKPEKYGVYSVMVQIREEDSKKSFDYVSKAEFEIRNIPSKKKAYIKEVVIDKHEPFVKNETIHIEIMAGGGSGDYLYGYAVKKDGMELEGIEYGPCSWVNFTPETNGEFELQARVKEVDSPYRTDDTKIVRINVFEFAPGKIDYVIMPRKKHFIVSDKVSLEAIVQNTQNVVLKYILKINNNIVEETEFVESKKYEFTPKCSGIYSVVILVKNKKSGALFDSKNEVRIKVYDSYPITSTKLLKDRDIIKANEPVTFTASYEGGAGVIFEFYIMEEGQWRLVQGYSKKNYYSFIPFNKGLYKVLALLRSQNNMVAYEDYDILVFDIE